MGEVRRLISGIGMDYAGLWNAIHAIRNASKKIGVVEEEPTFAPVN
ncbi:MAG: hypothetical protein H6617_01950 [Bdellovibrionaceae bacterium]|nr:hypothetical protein [Pseudobdellovibrionaceae bacterium]